MAQWPAFLGTGIQRRLAALGVAPADVEESFQLSGGPGGQKVNKTSSAVRLRHRPSRMEIVVRDDRNQRRNRVAAWERLCGKLEEIQRAARRAERESRELERRRTRPKPARVKRAQVASKRQRSERKQTRGRVRDKGED